MKWRNQPQIYGQDRDGMRGGAWDVALSILLGFGVAVFAVTMLAVLFTLVSMAVAGADEECPRRDYLELTADQLPCLPTIEFDGAGHAAIVGRNDTGLRWVAATSHVPDPDNWLHGQTLTAVTLLPNGEVRLSLPCQPGAAQVDVWLEGEDQPYAANVTLECGFNTRPETLGGAKDAVAADTASGGEGVTLAAVTSPTAAPAAPPPAVATTTTTTPPPLTVEAAAVARTAGTLPNTGRNLGQLIALGVIVLGVGLVIVGTWRNTRGDDQ